MILNILSLETETVLLRYAAEFSIKSSNEINLNRILLLALKENTVTDSMKIRWCDCCRTSVRIFTDTPVKDVNNQTNGLIFYWLICPQGSF
jgi:hypothetical protein